MVRMREMPVPSYWFASPIKVVCMVTNWLHAFSLAGLVDVVGAHLTFYWNALKGAVLVLESAIFLVKVRITLCTEGVSILFTVVVSPFVTIFGVDQ
jgi:hypothetical protein